MWKQAPLGINPYSVAKETTVAAILPCWYPPMTKFYYVFMRGVRTHEHPTMQNPEITPGNGLLLYFKTDDLDTIRQNAERMEYPVEADIHLNPNSTKKEFSLRDPDGYYITVTEYHSYEG